MSDVITQWLKTGDYLPPIMRDFHDQKDLFKTVHELVEASRIKHPDEHRLENLTWVDAHIYTVDIFLWFMARRGYTLQRSRQKLPFRNLLDDVREHNDKMREQMASVLRDAMTPPERRASQT